jgi:hypothetical protein
VHREDHVFELRDEAIQLPEVLRVLVRHRVADRVRNVDRGRTFLNGDLAHLGCEFHVGARRVHRGELDVVAVLLRLGDGGARLPLDVVARRLELVLDVNIRGGDEGVDPGTLRVLDRAPGSVDVLRVRTRQAADHRTLDLLGDRLHRLRVAR